MRRPLHLPLFVVSIMAAVALKVAVNEERQLTETIINAQVNYELPKDVMILEPVQQISVRVRGERSEIETLTPFNVQVQVTLREDELGTVTVSEERLVVRRPGDVEVVSKVPNFLTLTIERIERRILPVRAELSGEPSAGAVHGPPVVTPSQARVEGPSSMVRELTELLAPVRLEGHAITFDEAVAIAAPDPLVKIEPRQVVVHVPMTVPGSQTPLDEFLNDQPEPSEPTEEP